MCEHTKQLIAWMDGELAEHEAAEVASHVALCAECHECLAAYKQASAGFEMYCDAVVGTAETRAKLAVFLQRDPNRVAEEPRAEGAARQFLLSELKLRPPKLRIPRWQKRVGAAIVGSAIAAAAAVAMLLMLPRHRVAQTPAPTTESAHNAASGPAITPAQGGALHAVLPLDAAHVSASAAAPASDSTLHAVQRPAESIDSTEQAKRAEPNGEVQVPATQGKTAPTADVAQRTTPLAVSTNTMHRRGAARPARLENATRAARQQTAQNGQMRSVSTALRPQGESKPQNENASVVEPPIEIAVPTEGMFPPGAVPEGIGFTAVVTISADDSALGSGLRQQNGGLSPSPRLTGFSNGGRRR